MRRGTRVGQAYIALTADGSGINDDIADSLDDADFEGMGERHGKEYSERFKSHLDSLDSDFSSMLRSLGKAIESDDSMTIGIRRQVNDAFTGGDLDALTKGVGERLGLQLGSEMQPEIERAIRVSVNDSLQKIGRTSNFDMSDFIRSIDSGNGSVSLIGPILDRATAEARRSMEEQAREMMAVQTEALNEDAQRTAEHTRQRTDMYRRMYDQIEDRERESTRIYDAMVQGETDRLNTELDRRAQMEEDDARRRNRTRVQYEAALLTALEQQDEDNRRRAILRDEESARRSQQADDAKFRRYDDMARRLTSNIEFDPRIDTERVTASIRKLRADLEARDDLELQLSAFLPARERERVKAELESIRARIRVSLDEDHLNKELLRAQGIRDRSAVGGGRDSNIGDRIGKMFGGGSRNNALNLIGKSIGGIINLTTTLSGGITKLTGIGGEGASMFSKMAVAGVATGAALAIVAAVAAILVSVMSALLALVVAMAATITSALVIALGVLGAGLLAVAAAGGLVTAAFMSMTDAQKGMLGDAFQPLKAELTGIGQLMITQMIPYFQIWSDNLQKALMLAVPVAGIMGQAFGRAGAIITNAFSGPGFQMFATMLGVYLPSIVTNLSTALGGFLNGTMGVFSALLPYVNQFAGYLADVSEKFATWATSAEGQNAIVDFADRALVSLQSLWDFVTVFFGWLGDILFNADAQAAGNTIFDSLTRSFEGFRQSIADGSLENWFARAIEFGRDLKDVISSLSDAVKKLDNDGALEAAGNALGTMADVIQTLNDVFGPLIDVLGHVLPVTLGLALAPIWALSKAIEGIGNAIQWVKDLASDNQMSNLLVNAVATVNAVKPGDKGFIGPQVPGAFIGPKYDPNFAAQQQSMIDLGNKALNNTSKKNGGYKPDPAKAQYVNPYIKYAESIMKSGPTAAAAIRNALLSVNKQVAAAIRSVSTAENVTALRTSLVATMTSIRTTADQQVNSAQSALNSAAQSLASSTSAAATQKALRQVEKAQDDLYAAQRNQFRIYGVARKLNAQKIVTGSNVQRLLNGMKSQNATLADYAYARNIVTNALEKANKRLADAIAMRDQYKATVIDSVKTFGSIMTAQAKTVDGVEQALTVKDITSNLQARLKQIKDFQTNLRKLLALGLSNDAYKQLVDAGVEQGGAYAAAIVAGGQGSVQQINGLTAQINSAAAQLGSVASGRLYQAGVDAARGLVDGLESLSSQLDAAATRLGNAIAKAVKKSLGIHSPSRVMRNLMTPVGDGAVLGLDAQHAKVDAAASRFADRIAVSPEVAEYSATQRAKERFSETPAGGAPKKGDEHHWHITTPTEDPVGVAREAINEMTGRLG